MVAPCGSCQICRAGRHFQLWMAPVNRAEIAGGHLD
jgi:hypothetical protein